MAVFAVWEEWTDVMGARHQDMVDLYKDKDKADRAAEKLAKENEPLKYRVLPKIVK